MTNLLHIAARTFVTIALCITMSACSAPVSHGGTFSTYSQGGLSTHAYTTPTIMDY